MKGDKKKKKKKKDFICEKIHKQLPCLLKNSQVAAPICEKIHKFSEMKMYENFLKVAAPMFLKKFSFAAPKFVKNFTM